MDLGGTRLAFDFRRLEAGQGLFYAGSFDGELVYADFIKPEGEENPDYAKSCLQVGCRMSLGKGLRLGGLMGGASGLIATPGCATLYICHLHLRACGPCVLISTSLSVHS